MIDPLILRPDESILTRYPELVKLAAELSDIYADRKKLVTDNALQLIGTLLWRALDADEPFQQARKRAGQHLLPIVIESGKPEIRPTLSDVAVNCVAGSGHFVRERQPCSC